VTIDERTTARTVHLTVNGTAAEMAVEPRTTLLDALREQLGLTGAHAGCEHGGCGACTVVVDGQTALSCLMLAVQGEGRSITTIEGLGDPEHLHPVMDAFHRCHGLQCGFCTPAMVLAANQLLETTPSPSDAEIREALAGNLCRCTGYAGVVAAVQLAAHERGAAS
jgi:carbon-monoxide dehydrogenase small subunit